MTLLIIVHLFVSGLLATPGVEPTSSQNHWILAQQTEPQTEAEKRAQTRPPLPNVKTLKHVQKPPGLSSGSSSTRMQPIKPSIRPRELKPSIHQKPFGDKSKNKPPRYPKGEPSFPPPSRHLRPTQEADKTAVPGAVNTTKEADKKEEDQSGLSEKIIEKEKKCRPLPPRVRVLMNFNEAEVQEVVQWISEQTCKNFIIGDNIRGGKITILSKTPVTSAEAYRAFLWRLLFRHVSPPLFLSPAVGAFSRSRQVLSAYCLSPS